MSSADAPLSGARVGGLTPLSRPSRWRKLDPSLPGRTMAPKSLAVNCLHELESSKIYHDELNTANHLKRMPARFHFRVSR